VRVELVRVSGGASSGGGNFSMRIDASGNIMMYLTDNMPSASPASTTISVTAWQTKALRFTNYTPYNLTVRFTMAYV